MGDNSECARTVYCQSSDSGVPVVCTTYSQSLPFSGEGRDELAVRQSVIQACQANQATSNAECANNISCQPVTGSSAYGYECLAESQSLMFVQSNQNQTSARDSAIRVCEADHRTSNADCFSSVQCLPLPPSPQNLTCTTSSRSALSCPRSSPRTAACVCDTASRRALCRCALRATKKARIGNTSADVPARPSRITSTVETTSPIVHPRN